MSGEEQHSEILTTPWFKLIAQKSADSSSPYYIIQSTDAVSIIAMTKDRQVLLVQQYRQAIDSDSLELPGGHLKDAETPEEAARRELLEETGYQADALELSGILFPNTTRLGYKLWCYCATDATKLQEPHPGEISKLILCSPSDLVLFIKNGRIRNALDVAAIFLGLQENKIDIS
jgi:ADP-ribose pyrophosphatase